MLGDLFENTSGSPMMETGKSGKTFAPASKTVKKRYLADDMDLPPIKREKGQFSGLVNQGGTCYLNALFQALHFCPEFRKLILQVDLDEVTAYEKGSQKYKLIREFQAFFLRLKCQSFKNHLTSKVTACFGWESGDQAEQQDFAEAMRVVADTLERALFEAGLSDEYCKTFKGKTANYITCMECQNNSERTEDFYDLILPIKNFEGAKFSNIDESISFLLNPELMDGANQYSCDQCNGKRDALKGLKFKAIPDVLTLSLMRFDFNYQTFERVKINDYYKFDLRLDMSKYTGKPEDMFDLCAVILHRGDPYAGHYHAVIRDVLLEVNLCDQEYDDFQGGVDPQAKDNEEGDGKKETGIPSGKRGWLPNTHDVPSAAQEKLRVALFS